MSSIQSSHKTGFYFFQVDLKDINYHIPITDSFFVSILKAELFKLFLATRLITKVVQAALASRQYEGIYALLYLDN